jgi:hypothetical protein
MSARSPTGPEGTADEAALDAVAAETPGGDSPPDLTVDPAAMSESFARRTEELAPIYAAAITTLTWGFRTGAALLTAGLALALAKAEPLGRVAEPFDEVVPAVLDGRAAGIVDVAILWLMATPVAAVVVVAAGFLRHGDHRYAALSLLALAVLGISISLALAR